MRSGWVCRPAAIPPAGLYRWLNLKTDNFNPATTDHGRSQSCHDLASSGIIEPLDGAKTTVEPLITTSLDSTKIPAEKLSGLPDVSPAFWPSSNRNNKRYILAPASTGMAESAFPDRSAEAPEPAKPEAKEGETIRRPKPAEDPVPAVEAVKQSRSRSNIVVVADTDILDDRFWLQKQEFFGQRV